MKHIRPATKQSPSYAQGNVLGILTLVGSLLNVINLLQRTMGKNAA